MSVEAKKTIWIFGDQLNLGASEMITTFQSRFGREEWLQPYTDETLRSLPEQGVTSVQVVCPGFSADCLETIEEIGMENRDTFHEAGGTRYEYIPCLNAEPNHIEALTGLVKRELAGWLQQPIDRQTGAGLAHKMGAPD